MAEMAKVAYNTSSCDSIVELDGVKYPVPKMVKKAHARLAGTMVRPGGKVWIAMCLYLTPKGATSKMVEQVCGQAQLNRMNGLVNEGRITLKKVPGKDKVSGRDGITYYKVSVKK